MKIYRSVSLEQWNEVSFSCDTEAAKSIQLYTDKWPEDLPKEEDKEMVRGMRIIPYCDCFTSMRSPLDHEHICFIVTRHHGDNHSQRTL